MSGRKTQKKERKVSSSERQICIGRVCFEKDKYQPTPGAKYRYRAHRCDKPCEEGKNLCKSCLKHEEMFLSGDPRKWHGREGGPLPEESHIENSAWDLEWRVKEAAALQKQVAPKSEKAKIAVKKAVKAVQEVQVAADNVVDAMTEAVISTNNVDVRASPSPSPKPTAAELKAQKAVRKAIQARENAGELVAEANELVTAAEKVIVQEAKVKRTTQRRKKKSSPLIYRPGSAATTPRSSTRKSMSRVTPYASPQRPSVSPVGSYESPAAMMRRNWATPYGSASPSSAIMPVVTVKKTTSPASSSIPSSNSTNLEQYAENLLLA